MAKDLNLVPVGAAAPDFTVKDQSGNPLSLSAFKGKKVALYFYPKDDTPGCTKEACNLRDNHQVLADKGIVVLGVSTDNEKSHQKFIAKYDLPFALLADTDLEIVKKYGVWGEKSMYGRTYEGTHRITYLIDEQGKVAHVIDKVKVGEHAEQVLELFNN
jgi:peroxiredoxin Q/BCP